MTDKNFIENLIEVIANNSLLEGEDNDSLLFKSVKSVKLDNNFNHRIFVETDDKVFALSIDSYRKWKEMYETRDNSRRI